MKKILLIFISIVITCIFHNYSSVNIARNMFLKSNGNNYTVCLNIHDEIANNTQNSQQERTCYSCKGRGQVNCSQCNGKGYIVCGVCSGNGWITCSTCKGSGRYYIMGEYITCPQCDGLKAKRCYRCNGNGRRNCCGSGKKTCSVCKGHGTIR
jgi:hypothetical protein